MTISSGLLLADRYRLDSRIAVGGMGEVWQASDTRLDRAVAVKILKAELSGDAEFLHRFRTEARTTASLNHPGIAAVHDYGEASSGSTGDDKNDLAYLVMEMVDGEPLAGILAREGRIKPERLLPILEQAGRALNAAHERGLVHRDVKPGNILVVRTGDGSETVKVTDFGIAKAADAAPVTASGMVMGTAHYIAPEQATGAEASPASDVYSLAVCGYECLVGHRPFLSENAVTVAMMHIRDVPPPLPPDVPPTVRCLIESTLVKDPKQRYANGAEFADATALVRAGHQPPTPVGITHTPPSGLPAQGHLAQHPPPPALAGGPPLPADPAPAAGGPATHPPMAPVQTGHPGQPVTPGGGVYGQQPPKNRTWLWVLLTVVGITLAVLAAVLIPIMAADSDEPETDPGGGIGPPTQQVPGQGPRDEAPRFEENLPGFGANASGDDMRQSSRGWGDA